MAALKDIRKRITSIKKTQKVTRAMKLVAAAKLRRAQQAALASRAYVDALVAIVGNIAKSVDAQHDEDTPKLMQRAATNNTDLIVLTSDRGFCGGFNENLIRASMAWIQHENAQGKTVSPVVFGRKGRASFARLKIAAQLREEVMPETSPDELVQLIQQEVTKRFLNAASGRVVLAYNRFVSAGRQEIYFEELLPFGSAHPHPSLSQAERAKDASLNLVEHIYEPNKSEVLAALVEQTLQGLIRQALLDSRASELAARMQAMDNATKNASEMIDDLTLQYNRARQAAITAELLDILGGAAALQQ